MVHVGGRDPLCTRQVPKRPGRGSGARDPGAQHPNPLEQALLPVAPASGPLAERARVLGGPASVRRGARSRPAVSPGTASRPAPGSTATQCFLVFFQPWSTSWNSKILKALKIEVITFFFHCNFGTNSFGGQNWLDKMCLFVSGLLQPSPDLACIVRSDI